jgi:regulator of replication initiation timing
MDSFVQPKSSQQSAMAAEREANLVAARDRIMELEIELSDLDAKHQAVVGENEKLMLEKGSMEAQVNHRLNTTLLR